MTHLSLSVLGMLQVFLDGRPVVGFESNKTRALLAYLAVEADQPHSRDELAGLLWPDQPDQVARNNLRQTLANLRHAIGDQTADPAFLSVTREIGQFNAGSDVWLDAGEFTDLLTACDKHVHRRPETCKSCARRLLQASELYRGNFLEQFFLNDSTAFEEWALVKREDLRRLAPHATLASRALPSCLQLFASCFCPLTSQTASLGSVSSASGTTSKSSGFGALMSKRWRAICSASASAAGMSLVTCM